MRNEVVANSGERAEPAELVAGLYTDGIITCRGAFSREWAAAMHEDIMIAFAEAVSREGGAVGRGPQRYYVEIHPEQLRGFVDLASHPWVTAVSEAVLGPDYEIVEVGFDIPFAGAQNQPWHRDFPAPPETYEQHRLTSLAFNLTAVDSTAEMGPFPHRHRNPVRERAGFRARHVPGRNGMASV